MAHNWNTPRMHENPTFYVHNFIDLEPHLRAEHIHPSREVDHFVDHDATFVVHVQHGLIPERKETLVHHLVVPFQDLVDVVEVILDRIDVPQPERKCATFRQEFWVLQ